MWSRLRAAVVERFWARRFRSGGVTTWMHEPGVREAVNRRISGEPGCWPLEWLAQRHRRVPFARAVSLGCGEGALERDLAAKGLAQDVLGLDLSTAALATARQRAADAGLEGRLHYERADLDALELPAAAFEAAFFHQSLHHVARLETCLDAVRASLVPGGTLYLDEYVGPSRHDWRLELLERADEIYANLPPRARRRRRLALPVDWRDPSEAIRSAEIPGAVAERFEILERRDYGGNLLAIIHPHLRLDQLAAEERRELIERLLAAEDELLAAGVASFYAVILARRVNGRRGDLES